MEPQTPVAQEQQQGVPQKPHLFIQYRKVFIAGGAVLVVLIICISTLFLLHPKTPPVPVKHASETQSTTNQPAVLVVSDAANITLTKVNNTALTKILAEAKFFQPNIHTVTFHLTNVLLANPNMYRQRFLDSTHKIILGGFYETTNPSTMSEDVYIYNGQTTSSPSNVVVSNQFWTYTLSSIWYLANAQAYISTDTTQLETLSQEQYQFMQAHAINPMTVTVQ